MLVSTGISYNSISAFKGQLKLPSTSHHNLYSQTPPHYSKNSRFYSPHPYDTSDSDKENDGGWMEVRKKFASPSPPRSFKKQKICIHHSRKGTGFCNFGAARCKFLHPEDGAAFDKEKKLDERKKELEADLEALHIKRRNYRADPIEELELETQILQKVKERNLGEEYDFHFLTLQGAEIYFMEIVEDMLQKGVPSSQLIVGRGKHSYDGVPKIKKMIMERLQGFKGVRIVVDSRNEGVLNLSF